MKLKKVKVASLVPVEKNCRRHSPKQIAELVRSIKAFGQTRPFVIDEKGVVLIGNGMLAAMQSAGIEDAEAYVVQGWSEAQKRKLMLSDNKCYELGSSDIDAIFDTLKELGAGSDFDVPGFEEESLRRLCDSVCEEAFVPPKLSTYTAPQSAAAKSYEKQAPAQIPVTGIPESAPIEAQPEPAPVIVHPASGEADYIICPHCGGRIPRS